LTSFVVSCVSLVDASLLKPVAQRSRVVVVSVADVAMLDAYPSLLDSVGQHFTQ